MNIKEFILPIIVALGFTGFIQYYYLKVQPQTAAQTTFVANQIVASTAPINTDIDYLDSSLGKQAITTSISTQWADLVFSSAGGALVTIDNKKHMYEAYTTMQTVHVGPHDGKEQGLFLVALDNQTPFNYTLENYEVIDNKHKIRYVASSPQVHISKEFIIDQQLPSIELQLTVTPLSEKQTARIFVQGPYMPTLADDILGSVVIDNGALFAKKTLTSLTQGQGWLRPTLFGIDNRYFVHALIADADGFAQRAYYKAETMKSGMFILESSPIQQKTTWHLQFYIGPKDIDLMTPVNPQLEKTLDYYGWLAPISKALLRLLKWLYNYLHNYGLAIILLTILIKLLMTPLTMRSENSMRQQKEMQKKLAYIQQKYKDNPDVLAQERAELVKKYGVPGLGGCLPILLQIPLFFALSRLLGNAIELYKAPMAWIPDLSAKDPWYILPGLVTFGMLSNISSVDDKQKLSIIAMALLFGALSANFSAGLALYITTNTLMGIVQTYAVKLFTKA